MLETLKDVRALIERPEHWTTEVYARDAYGSEVDAHDSGAVCWCLLGAVSKIVEDDIVLSHTVTSALLLTGEGEIQSLSWFNDDFGHARVLALIDRTIKRAS